MKYLLSLTLLFCSCLATAQCPPTTQVSILSQADVEAFVLTYPNCEEVSTLFIRDTDPSDPITTLEPLQLTALARVGRLYVSMTQELTTLSGLEGIEIDDGLGVFTTLMINYNASLRDLNGLEGITTVESVSISANPELVSVEGLENLTSVDGFLRIAANNKLGTLKGLDNLSTLSQLHIFSNNSLCNINRLSGVEAYEVTIRDNPKLWACSIPFCDHFANGGVGTIYNNRSDRSGCNSRAEILDNCGSFAQFLVKGVVKTELGVGTAIPINVTLSGGSFPIPLVVPTGSSFAFTDLEPGLDYTIAPSSPMTVPDRQVSNSDLRLLDAFLAGETTLSPLQLIAANLDFNNVVDNADRAILVGMISGEGDPPVPAMRFVAADFPLDEMNALATFPEVININDFSGDATADFDAVIMGDLDGFTDPEIVIQTSPANFYPGDSVTVNIVGRNFKDVTALTLRMRLDDDGNIVILPPEPGIINGTPVTAVPAGAEEVDLSWTSPDMTPVGRDYALIYQYKFVAQVGDDVVIETTTDPYVLELLPGQEPFFPLAIGPVTLSPNLTNCESILLYDPIDGDDCYRSYSYATTVLGGGTVRAVRFTALDGNTFSPDDDILGPGFWAPEFSPISRTIYKMGEPSFAEIEENFFAFRLNNPVTETQYVRVEYLDFNSSVRCTDSLVYNCLLINDCLEVAADTLVCSDDNVGYRLQMNFLVPDDNYTDDVGRVKVIVPNLAPIVYDFTPPLTAGQSFGIDTLLTGTGLMAGDTLKAIVTAHDGPEERLCCFADSLCLPIPECVNPCEELDAQVIFQPSESPDASECCFDVVVINNTLSPDLFDSLSIDLFFPGGQFPSFSPVSNPVWSFSLPGSNPFSWQFSGNPPTNGGMPEVIASFCIDRTEEEVFFEYSTTFIDTDSGEECALATEMISCDPLPVACDSISVTLAVNEEDSCCYYLIYENDLPIDEIDSVYVDIFEGPLLNEASVVTVLSPTGFSLVNETPGQFYLFREGPFGPIIAGRDTIMEFCLDPATDLDSTRIEVVTFLKSGDVMEPCRDTLAALCPAPDPCDSLAAYILPDEDEPCCYNVFLDNTYADEDDPLQSVTVNLIGGPAEEFIGVSRIPVAPGWAFADVVEARRRYTLTPSGASVPQGLGQQVFQFCVAEDFSTDSTYVEIAWQTATDTICADTVAAVCQNCMAIEEEELGCDNGQPTYAFTFTNYSEIPGNTIRVIYTEGVPEGIEMPETITLTEMVGPGETYSGTLLIDLNNDLEGEEVCFDIILEQVLPNQAAIRCCYVTHCVESLDCGPGSFAPDDGEVAILAYPNPTSGEVMLTSDYLGAAEVSLLSFTGRTAVVRTVEFAGVPVRLGLGNRPSGVYTVLVQFADGRQGVRRIVIK